MAALNDPRVYNNLSGPPFTYTPEACEAWHQSILKLIQHSLSDYKLVQDARENGRGQGKKWVGDLPVTAIREIEEGSESEKGVLEGRFIGEISFRRSGYELMRDLEWQRMAKEFNDGLEAGDSRIQWEVGFYLVPSVHGRGIMPSVLKTLTEGFLVEYMNVCHMKGSYLGHNMASKRVFEKCGWRLEAFEEDFVELDERKTGVKGMRTGLGMMRWDREEDDR